MDGDSQTNGCQAYSEAQRLPGERRLSERSIGVTKGKRRHIHDDPYAGGERSGKHAKPDVVSAKANANVCVHAPSSTFVAAPLASASASQLIT